MEVKKRGRPKKEQESKKVSPITKHLNDQDPRRIKEQSKAVTTIEKVNDFSSIQSVNDPSIAVDTILLPDFNGDNCEISIENWIDRFEELAELKNLNEHRMIAVLGNFLKKEALEWYMTTRKLNRNMSYDMLKKLFIDRFGLRLTSPITEFTHLKYDPSKGILDYYKNKRRLGILAGLSENHIISLMIDGLPLNLSSAFISVVPHSMDQFFEIASRAEMNFKLRENRMNSNLNKRIAPRSFSAKFPKKRKPPSPCRICENMGLKNRFHWSNDCFNRDNPNKRQKIETTNDRQPFKKALN